MLKLKISINLPQLLCIVVSVIDCFCDLVGFVLTVTRSLIRRRQGWKAHFRRLQRQADFH